jgi:transposase-like protein
LIEGGVSRRVSSLPEPPRKDREALLAFFDFPAEHWDHLRTSNPIESAFATVIFQQMDRRFDGEYSDRATCGPHPFALANVRTWVGDLR